jgi:putative acetyltransferase
MKQEYINRIRAFNRCYTQVLGLLNKGILGCEFGLSESRVMRELYFNPNRTSKEIANILELDKGFLSRLLKHFEKTDIVTRKKCKKDNRSHTLCLTKKGTDIYRKIDQLSDNQIDELFSKLTENQQKMVLNSMDTIQKLLNKENSGQIKDKSLPIIIRPIEEKDNQEIAILIRNVFEEFDAPKNGTVYSDPRTDMLYQQFKNPNSEYWVVEYHNKILGGCGFYPTEGLATTCAELVKFYLSPLLRGNGIGSYLFNMVEERAKKAGYQELYIESFPNFREAVTLYEKKGFKHLPSSLGNSGHSATTIHMIKNLIE